MRKPVYQVFIFANENVGAFGSKQIIPIQRLTIRQIFKKAFPKYNFKKTVFFFQGKIR